MNLERKSIDLERKPIDLERKSIELEMKSIELERIRKGGEEEEEEDPKSRFLDSFGSPYMGESILESI